jgi:hypothetical protein
MVSPWATASLQQANALLFIAAQVVCEAASRLFDIGPRLVER